jgi:hypothetical protein
MQGHMLFIYKRSRMRKFSNDERSSLLPTP